VFDHHLGKTWVISTGLAGDGSRNENRAQRQLEWWQDISSREQDSDSRAISSDAFEPHDICSNFSRVEFIARVERSQAYIRSGDIYQVNLSQRLGAPLPCSAWQLFERLTAVSPAPF